MMELSEIQQYLLNHKGALPQVAADSGVSYDSVLRIMRGHVNPRYSTMQALTVYIKSKKKPRRKVRAQNVKV